MPHTSYGERAAAWFRKRQGKTGMNLSSRDIFRAIHEGKWLLIEYRNRDGKATRYWGAVKDMNPEKGFLLMDGMHMHDLTVTELTVYFSGIKNAEIIEGTYCEKNQRLIDDISLNPEHYRKYFGNTANLKILTYYEMCFRMDATPYIKDFELINHLDDSRFEDEVYLLSDEQFHEIVKHFRLKQEKGKSNLHIQQIAMNELSIFTKRGLYLLAYRKMNLDVKQKLLRPDDQVTVCFEFQTDGGTVESARCFLDADDYELLNSYESNAEKIKDAIMHHNPNVRVDDMPYIIGIGANVPLDLHTEYRALMDAYEKDPSKVTFPIRAFFGELLERPRRSKIYPLALADNRINLDQLLAVNNAMKYPVAYIQGPPGTGKTNTIINTITTAFFNERTVLFSSYNNHPLDSVMGRLTSLKYKEKTIPFPVLRLGNMEKVNEACTYILRLYESVKKAKVSEESLDERKLKRTEKSKKLSELLKRYDEILDLQERKETLEKMISYEEENQTDPSAIPYQLDLKGRQLSVLNKEIRKKDSVTEEKATALLDSDHEALMYYLYLDSVKHIKRLSEAKYEDLLEILKIQDSRKQAEEFNGYIKDPEKLRKLLRVFPIIVTTCISAQRLGDPEPVFEMTVIDEAGQCNTAVSLIPVIRGENLMLVGDTQQLRPVILLDEAANRTLREKYNVPDMYDYRENSVYKVFLACDSVSDEILLRKHYRCHREIIGFNNKKYYNDRLLICTESKESEPLRFVNVRSESPSARNSSVEEADAVVDFCIQNPGHSIGVITPFVNQKKLIEEKLEYARLSQYVSCGTVHSFQGDEKDIILFSSAISDATATGTYDWLSNNKELINVATSRAKERLVVFGDTGNIERLHHEEKDDLYELVRYVKENGATEVTPVAARSRALGVKPFSTETEEAFLKSLSHALGNIWLSESKFSVHKEVPVSQVFEGDGSIGGSLFYTGRFDFVVYERMGEQELPVLAIELDGKEHFTDEAVRLRDRKKEEICRAHHLEMIRVENTYARRYAHIKGILESYFASRR